MFVVFYDLPPGLYSIGIITGIFGLVSTLAALHAYNQTCVEALDSNVGSIYIAQRLGVGYYLVYVTALAKVVDIWAHLIVPVPAKAYWTPDTKEVTAKPEKDRDVEVQNLLHRAAPH
jgi:hypothetical protein